jgi:hypothetical protein
MRNTRQHHKDKYTTEKQISECIVEVMKNANNYFENEKEKIDITNREIRKNVKTEFIALKILTHDNYEFIKVENELNRNFEFIELDNTLIGLIEAISKEIFQDYQLTFLKKKDNDVIFDYEALKKIADFMRWNIKIVKLLHKFKAKQKKGFRAVKSYLNSLKSIIDKTYNEALRKEAQKEYNYYEFIETKNEEFKKNGFIFDAIKLHNESYLDVGNLRNKYFGYVPKKDLDYNKCIKLEKLIKAKIIEIIPKSENY